MDNRSFIFCLVQIFQIQIFEGVLPETGVGLCGRLPGFYFRKVVRNSLAQGLLAA